MDSTYHFDNWVENIDFICNECAVSGLFSLDILYSWFIISYQ